jgi:hypothetical protein
MPQMGTRDCSNPNFPPIFIFVRDRESNKKQKKKKKYAREKEEEVGDKR